MPSAVPPPIPLAPSDADRYVRLRRRMLVDTPWAFDANPDDDSVQDPVHLAALLGATDAAVFAFEAAQGGDLVAAVGVTRGRPPKFAHRARVWGAYVAPTHRGRGLGRALLVASIALARAWDGVAYVDLSVSEHSPEALRLYESLGFAPWGREPAATAHEGRFYDEIYMALRVRGV